MKSEVLSDLQSLVFRVRSPQSKQNLAEAIQAYYGGAYRAAIMSVWVAVAYDIFDKISELAFYDDHLAQKHQNELKKEIDRKDILNLSKREQNLLKVAREEFEFISEEQRLQFDRLKEDRNHCAHPSYTSDGSIFRPSPELVRFYIVYAVDNLLAFGPVRGQSSIQAITTDIMGDVFPSSPEAAGKFLEEKYLKHAKPILIDNLFKLLIKVILGDIDEWSSFRGKAIIALRGIGQMQAAVHDQWMRDNLEKACDKLQDNQILRLFGLLCYDDRFWTWVGEHHRTQIKDFLENRFSEEMRSDLSDYFDNRFGRKDMLAGFGVADISALFKAMNIDELKPSFLNIFAKVSNEEKIEIIKESLSKELCDSAIEFFGDANSYREAERRGEVVLTAVVPVVDLKQIKAVFDKVLYNGQIYSASKIGTILSVFIDLLSIREEIQLSEVMNWKETLRALILKGYGNYGHLYSSLHHLKLINESYPELSQADI